MKIPRMVTHATVALICFAFSFVCLEALSLRAAQDSNATGGLKGQFGVPLPDNKLIIPKETHIWILYGPESVSGDLLARSAWENTPAFQFHLQREKCWHNRGYDKEKAFSNKRLDDLKKEPDPNRRKQEAQALAREVGDTLNAHQIQCTDEAIAYVSDWAQKHPNNAWQVKTLTADENGLWSNEDLTPGDHTVIARAHFAGHDALWQISYTVKQGQTQVIRPFQPVMSDHVR
jgi:hypothetical protein